MAVEHARGGLTVRVWGARGSVPAPGFATRRHGGNTSCVTVESLRDCVVLDGGTGIRALGDTLLARMTDASDELTCSLFVTHAHWDHVQGLPYFAPLYHAATRMRIYGPPPLGTALERAIRDQMRPPAFPVAFDALPSRVTFHVGSDEGVGCGSLHVRAVPVRHPGGAVGWRVDGAGGAAIAYMPDNEIAGATESSMRAAWRDALRGVSLLVHDATYTREELPHRHGWGHSSWEEAVRLAIECGVERLVLFHHHPDRSDRAIDALVDDARTLVDSLGAPLRVTAAVEGLTLHL